MLAERNGTLPVVILSFHLTDEVKKGLLLTASNSFITSKYNDHDA